MDPILLVQKLKAKQDLSRNIRNLVFAEIMLLGCFIEGATLHVLHHDLRVGLCISTVTTKDCSTGKRARMSYPNFVFEPMGSKVLANVGMADLMQEPDFA
jgi:hypothetical protein